jgi:hypothetical protein
MERFSYVAVLSLVGKRIVTISLNGSGIAFTVFLSLSMVLFCRKEFVHVFAFFLAKTEKHFSFHTRKTRKINVQLWFVAALSFQTA